MDLTPAQSWLLAALPENDGQLLKDSRTAANLNLCVGLPLVDDELKRMMASLQLLGLCEHRADGWHRTVTKQKTERSLF